MRVEIPKDNEVVLLIRCLEESPGVIHKHGDPRGVVGVLWVICSTEPKYVGVNFNRVNVRRSMSEACSDVITSPCAHHQDSAGFRNEPVRKLVSWQPGAVWFYLGKARREFTREIKHLLMVVVINVYKVCWGTRPP